ncbi:phage tail tape measure protein [Edaphobacillus lindanitolerans]
MRVGAGLTAGLTVPLVGLAAAAIKTGMSFDDSMAQVAAVSGATGKDFERLESIAREMGATTRYSASEAADGLLYMAMAGWKTDQMIAGLPPILNLATAAGEDLGVTSDIVTDALTGFGLQAQDAGKFADVLAAASSNANTNVSLLGESFKYVAPVAGAMGYTAEDTAIALGLMANAGIKGSQAGTALRTMMTNLVKPTKEMKKSMDKLGISITDSKGELKPFSQVMDELREKFGKLDEAQQAQYAATIFGKEAMAGALSVINASESDYDKLTEAIRNSEGATERMAVAMEATLGGTWRNITSALEELGIQIYKILLPYLQKASDGILKFLEWLTQLSPGVKVAAVAFAAFLAAIGPIVTIIGVLIVMAGSLIGNFGVLATKFAPVIKNSTLLSAGFKGITRAISLMFGPVGAIIALLLTLIPVFIKLYQENETFRNIVQTVWAFIQNIITQVVSAVVTFVMGLWGQLTAFWQENGDMILQATQNVWNVISTVITTVMGVIAAVFQAVWPVVQALVMQVWENIKGVIQGALDIIMGVVKVFAGLFTGNWSKMWEGIKQIFSGALNLVWNLVQLHFIGKIMGVARSFVGLFRGSISSLWSAVRSIFTTALNAIKNFFSKSFNNMRSVANTSMSTIRSLISTILNAIKNFFTSSLGNILNAVRSKFSSVVSTIRSKMTEALSRIRTILSDMVKAVVNKASSMLQAGKDLISGLIKGIKNMGTAAIGAITGVVDGVINKAKSLLKINSPSKVFRRFGMWVSEGLGIGVDSEADRAVQAVAAMSQDMTSAFSPDLAFSDADYASQLKSVHRQAQGQMTSRLDSEISVSKQPAIIQLRLGNSDYVAYSSDIYATAERQLKREGAFRT